MKRQRGRGRKSNGNQANRHFESNGPDVKIRGSANQIYDKYAQLGRDAFSSGDRVKGENYLQHAEHYYRIMQSLQPPKREDDRQDAQPQQHANTSQEPGDQQGQRSNGAEAQDGQPNPLEVVNPEASTLGEAGQGDAPKPDGEEGAPRRSRRRRRDRNGAGEAPAAADGQPAESSDADASAAAEASVESSTPEAPANDAPPASDAAAEAALEAVGDTPAPAGGAN